MASRVWRLLLAGALACAVLGAAARADVPHDRPDRLAPTAVALGSPATPVDAALIPVRQDHAVTVLAAGRSLWAAFRDWAGPDGFAVPVTAVIASLAVALAVCVRLDVAPTARLGLARRRGPPALLLART